MNNGHTGEKTISSDGQVGYFNGQIGLGGYRQGTTTLSGFKKPKSTVRRGSRIRANCQKCGKSYTTGLVAYNRSKTHFCSRICAGTKRMKVETIACAVCRKLSIRRPPSSAVNQKYCSPTCSGIGHRREDLTREFLTGRCIKELSRDLFLSRNAIKYHLNKLFRKHGVQDRIQLMAKLMVPRDDLAS